GAPRILLERPRAELARPLDLCCSLRGVVAEAMELDAGEVDEVLRGRGGVVGDARERLVRLLPLVLAGPAGAHFTRDAQPDRAAARRRPPAARPLVLAAGRQRTGERHRD